jgi:L-fuculose-phosphate aldolase
MDLRKKMGLPGKHPGCKKCPNLGTPNCKCKDNGGACTCGGDHGKDADADLVAEITRRVMAALGK